MNITNNNLILLSLILILIFLVFILIFLKLRNKRIEKLDIDIKEEVEIPKEPVSFLNSLKSGLSKTSKALTSGIEKIFTGKNKIDSESLEELEELLITSDIGVQTSMELIQKISKDAYTISTVNELKDSLKNEILSILTTCASNDKPADYSASPHVIMVVGVNGTGKTTTIGKISSKLSSQGKKILIGAADTFRAAAVEQLTIWAQRAGSEIVKHKENADPAAVAFDSIEAGIARKSDIVIIDTAGRLHTHSNLMEELKKIKRTIANRFKGAPHEILLVLDATTGQNGLSQAKIFHDALGVTGIVVTKLDGTAKGGIVVGICQVLNIPLKYIGVGEKIDDLKDFDPKEFVEAIF